MKITLAIALLLALSACNKHMIKGVAVGATEPYTATSHFPPPPNYDRLIWAPREPVEPYRSNRNCRVLGNGSIYC